MRYLYVRCVHSSGFDDTVAQGYGDESQPRLLGAFGLAWDLGKSTY